MDQTEPFADRFAAAWAAPTPEGLAALLSQEVVLYQPHCPAIRGKSAAAAEFSHLLRWIPRTHSIVKSSQETSEIAFIEHELRFPVGSQVIRVPTVDRFELNKGLAKMRVAYFDSARLTRAILRHPSLWPGFFRYRFGR